MEKEECRWPRAFFSVFAKSILSITFFKAVFLSAASKVSHVAKSGMSQEEALEMMEHETWLTADQAKEKKLIDKVMFEEKETNLQLVAGPMFKLPDQTKMNAARGG